MRFIVRLASHALFACGALAFILLPRDRYGWMRQMDPSMAALPEGDTTQTALFAASLLAAIVVSQLALAATAARRGEKIVSLVLVAVAVVLWWARR